MELGKCYLFKGGVIKPANKRYTAIKNEYQLTFNKDAEVISVEDDDNIKMPDEVYSFTSLKEVKSLPDNSRIDFIGAVHSVGDLDEINLKSGRVKPV